MNPKNDPLIKAVRKTRSEFEKTPLGRLQRLSAEVQKWRRRETIARNKLSDLRSEIAALAQELAGGPK